ncbi:YdiK family protein [Alkalihalobacillus pseudalcaliphilus]|uniref:YdiK family protein n=1 Tax=Alkalihalobacillus pseudalcaliphilus TaxID=79884 RepID=UPI00064DA1E1|nr:YdiK family protein [Alkalihalobacillus pseudalcaliphilus]KMK74380.1 hypothetical protein AB990_20930 [Alkalihalobacillus pseudalcaliphilus]
MRFSPTGISVVYFVLGTIFILLAIRSVNVVGWNLWTFFLIGFATFDYFLAFKYYQVRKIMKQMQNGQYDKENKDK